MDYFDRANNAFMKAYGRFDVTFDHGSLVAEQGESAIDIGAFGDLVEEQDAALLTFGTGALLP